MANSIVKIMFDGEMQDCLVRVDGSGETVCYAKSGRVLKFAEGVDLKEAIKAHNKAHSVAPIPADEAEAAVDTELLAWLAGEDTVADEGQ